MSVIGEIKEAVMTGDRGQVFALTERALAEKLEPDAIIQLGYIPAMTVVGERFGKGEIYIPEMLIAARAMKSGLEVLRPLLAGAMVTNGPTVLMGTVKGDIHEIGKNLVAMMMEGAGMEVVDLGTDLDPEGFVEAVTKYRPQFLGMSALLTTTMSAMEETIAALAEAGVREQIKILVGGAPVSQNFADEIGADGFAENAGQAVELVRRLLR